MGFPGHSAAVPALNERIARAASRSSSTAPQFPDVHAEMPRVNGRQGIGVGHRSGIVADPRERHVGQCRGSRIHARADQGRPRVEMTTELKCIEGWSTVVHWAAAPARRPRRATGLADRTVAAMTRRPALIRLARDARRQVLRRPRHGQRPSSPDPALLRDGGRTPDD